MRVNAISSSVRCRPQTRHSSLAFSLVLILVSPRQVPHTRLHRGLPGHWRKGRWSPLNIAPVIVELAVEARPSSKRGRPKHSDTKLRTFRMEVAQSSNFSKCRLQLVLQQLAGRERGRLCPFPIVRQRLDTSGSGGRRPRSSHCLSRRSRLLLGLCLAEVLRGSRVLRPTESAPVVDPRLWRHRRVAQ